MAEEQNFLERMIAHVGERVQAIPGELLQTVTDKVVPQGATELAQALYGGGQSNVFTPYGHAQQPLAVEGPAASYQDVFNNYIAQTPPQQQEEERGMER